MFEPVVNGSAEQPELRPAAEALSGDLVGEDRLVRKQQLKRIVQAHFRRTVHRFTVEVLANRARQYISPRSYESVPATVCFPCQAHDMVRALSK